MVSCPRCAGIIFEMVKLVSDSTARSVNHPESLSALASVGRVSRVLVILVQSLSILVKPQHSLSAGSHTHIRAGTACAQLVSVHIQDRLQLAVWSCLIGNFCTQRFCRFTADFRGRLIQFDNYPPTSICSSTRRLKETIL